MCLFNKDILRLDDMEIRSTFLIFIFLFSALIATYAPGVTCEVNNGEPLEAQCRPYVEEALKKLETGEVPADIEVLDASEKPIDDDSSLPVTDSAQIDDEHASEEGKSDQEDSQETNNETNEDTSMEEAEHFETKNQISNEIEDETEETKEQNEFTSTENAADDETIHTVTSKNVETGSDENSHDTALSKENESEEHKPSDEEGKMDDDTSKIESEETQDEGEDSKEAVEHSIEQNNISEVQDDKDDLGSKQVSEEEHTSQEEMKDEKEDSIKSLEQSDEQTSAEATEEGASKSAEKIDDSVEQAEASTEQTEASIEQTEASTEQTEASAEQTEASAEQTEASAEQTESSAEQTESSAEQTEASTEHDESSTEQAEASTEETEASTEQTEASVEQTETTADQAETSAEHAEASDEQAKASAEQSEETAEQVGTSGEKSEITEKLADTEASKENDIASNEQDEVTSSKETHESSAENKESETEEMETSTEVNKESEEKTAQESKESKENSQEVRDVSKEESVEDVDALTGKTDSGEISTEKESGEVGTERSKESTSQEDALIKDSTEDISSEDAQRNASTESLPEEDLMQPFDIPTNLRPRSHISEILHLNDDSNEIQKIVNKASDVILKDLKRIYENAIKPLETLYKYRDLSNRHFGDPEIFSKPLVLFMGPWSGGKSSIINYLLDNEYVTTSLRTGAEPSPAYFNILMWGEKPELLDGTQLAADWTFSGLQKFGQGLEERLSGLKLPSKLLEKVNIVEIPGILEVRKQVSRVFPFNDACQWFIDRADIIFLVYDPSKLDVGPETEAILDQLKGREYQTRILLNKADQVKAEELMRVQGALIWNISPLMSSAQPPVMYLTSLWSRPYEEGAPVRLLQAQERSFLRDIKSAVDKRIENKIASARRFAVRVRNHAKMVDCYLTTYYNHKSVFANKKIVSDQIIEHPQDYHIYEGLSTLTNISRYDLPDPDVYRDFFRLNPLYEFQQLSATCTYFRGCPINRLDVAIAYDFPELVGKYKKLVEPAPTNIKGADKS